jgi:hypothetical protein
MPHVGQPGAGRAGSETERISQQDVTHSQTKPWVPANLQVMRHARKLAEREEPSKLRTGLRAGDIWG